MAINCKNYKLYKDLGCSPCGKGRGCREERNQNETGFFAQVFWIVHKKKEGKPGLNTQKFQVLETQKLSKVSNSDLESQHSTRFQRHLSVANKGILTDFYIKKLLVFLNDIKRIGFNDEN